jgi:predicted enzyme related to lactoylglutathione lyase
MSTGSFIWYELMTPDPDAAAKFYGAVVGWKIAAPAPTPDGQDYRNIQRSDGGAAGGVLRLTADMQKHGAQPIWLGYLHVGDVETAVRSVQTDGGKLLMPRKDLPVGSIAMVTDPMGTPFYLMAPIPPPGKPNAKSDVFDTKALQRVCWNELLSPDLTRAKQFYSKHFNFQFNEVMPMGAMGDYCFIDHDGVRLGAIMQRPATATRGAAWLFYFRVDSLAVARRAVESGGGRITQSPHEVPGNEWVVEAIDPAGAAFGLVSKSNE